MFKKFVAVTVLSGLMISAHAKSLTKEDIEVCNAHNDLAMQLMLVRQTQPETTLDNVLDITGVGTTGGIMAKEAFDTPVYESREGKVNAIAVFGVKAYNKCIKQFAF